MPTTEQWVQLAVLGVAWVIFWAILEGLILAPWRRWRRRK